jgi:hypothetical protein
MLALLITPIIVLPSSAAAVDAFNGNNVCSGGASGSTVCKGKDPGSSNPFIGKDGLLTRIIDLLTVVVGIVAIIVIILAGLKFITSGSNPQEVANARERILYAGVALIIAASAQILVRFVLNKIVQ